MLKLLKCMLWIFPGFFGLVWDPFERRGMDRLKVENIWVLSFSRRSGFADSAFKRDLKLLFKDFKKYSKKQPNYLPKCVDLITLMRYRLRFMPPIYMGETSWRGVYANLTSQQRAYNTENYLVVNPPIDLIDSEEFEGRYPSISIARHDVEYHANKALVSCTMSGTKLNDPEDVMEMVSEVTKGESFWCGCCDENYEWPSVNGSCPECGEPLEMDKGLRKALNKVYDKIADRMAKQAA